MRDLRTLVFEALDNAKEGGFDMSGYTPEALAHDLLQYDSDVEAVWISSNDTQATLEQTISAIQEWRASTRTLDF